MAEATQQPNQAADTEYATERGDAVLKGAADDPTVKIWESIDQATVLVEKAKKQGIFNPRPPLRKISYKLAEMAGVYPVPNLAVVACMGALTTMMEESKKNKVPQPQAANVCRLAYCEALPKLSTRDHVSDFIACVVHGMALDIIPDTHGTRLLYGAQVACAAFPPRRKRTKGAKKPLNDTPKPPETSTESEA